MLSGWNVLVVASLTALAASGDISSRTMPGALMATAASTAAGVTDIELNAGTRGETSGGSFQTPVTGEVTRVSGTCPELTFVLSGVTIHVSATTRFEGGGCGDLKVGVRAGAMGSRRADGSVDAERVKVAGLSQPAVAGLVSARTGACPALTFVVDGATVRTSSRTVFEGGGCGDLKVGMRAGAIGPKASDGSIEAERVKMAPPPLPQVAGTVASVAGACPALTFVVDGATVRTSSRTVFEGGGCGDLKVGMRAGAIGPKASDGSIDAERVKMAPPPPPQVAGRVVSVAGACPDLTFVIEGTTVHTSAKTAFESCACSDVKVGVRAGAIGPKRADGSIDAEKVRVAR